MSYGTPSIMKSLRPSIKSSCFSSLGLDANQWDCSSRSILGLNQSLGPPAESNPLADVIGQTGPQGFHRHLEQTTQAKLPQPDFVLDPGIRKFRHPSPLLVDLASFRGLHLCFKGCQRRRLLSAHQGAPSSRPRATLGLKRTDLTIRCPSPVTTMQPTPFPFLSFVKQHLTPGTPIPICAHVIRECLGIKFRTFPATLQRLSLIHI